MTMQPTHPREKLIRTAARLVHHQGWAATGINQILDEASVPKGSFYYYFRSKEILGVAVLQNHLLDIEAHIARTLERNGLSIPQALDAFFTDLIATHQMTGFRLGCPVGSFAAEVATQSPLLLAEANRAFRSYFDGWERFIKRGQCAGELPRKNEASELANLAVSLTQGALLAMKCSSSPRPLELARAALSSLLGLATLATTDSQLRIAPELRPVTLAS